MAQSVQDFWRSIFAGSRFHTEDPLGADEITDAMHASSVPTFSYFFMLSAATAIATFGMLANSAPAIIGAMIIAPLMGPIVSLAFGLVCIDWRMIASSILSVLAGVLLVVLFSYLCTQIIGLRVAGSEMLGRSAPTSLDLGVAMAAGAAGAFAHTRKSIMNSIAGVAIAVALVPPLTVVGIGLALGRKAAGASADQLSQLGYHAGGFDIALGAMVLFLTNLIGIVFVAAAVFIFCRYGQWKKGLVSLAVFLVFLAMILQPLNHGLYRLYVKSTTLSTMMSLLANRPDLFTGRSKLLGFQVNYDGDRVSIDLNLAVPVDDMERMQDRVDTFHQYLTAALERDVEVKVDIFPVEFRTLRSTVLKPQTSIGVHPVTEVK